MGDPYVSRMISQYRIESEAEQRTPHFALKACENEGGVLKTMLEKNEARMIIQNFSILGKASFIEAMNYVNQMNEQILDLTPLFEHPVSQYNVFYLITQEEYRDRPYTEVFGKLNEFPIQMSDLVIAQRAIARKFRENVEAKWTESIA